MKSFQDSLCFDEYDDEIPDGTYSPEQERELLFFATGFMGELKYIAKQCISSFFQDRDFHCGGKIPCSLLSKDDHVLTVINYDIINSLNTAYEALKNHELPQNCVNDMPEDIKLVLKILDELAINNVPQQFAGGMMILYLKLIEGIEIG
jgi:hypothetical protein